MSFGFHINGHCCPLIPDHKHISRKHHIRPLETSRQRLSNSLTHTHISSSQWWQFAKMAMKMAIRASATQRPPYQMPTFSSSSSSSSPFSNLQAFSKPKFRASSVSLPASTTLTLLGLFSTTHEAKALTLPKEQIVSSLTEVENTIDTVQLVGSSIFDTTGKVLDAVIKTLKPAAEVALPIAKQASEQALKLASPVVSEASKKAQEAIESAGVDTTPVINAAKTVVDAAKQTSQVIEGAKPIASSAVESISSADPLTLVGSAGALVLAYFLLPPVWSAISYSLRGYKGDLTPAQTLDFISTKNYILVDIRSEKDKDKAGIPRLPSSAKSRLISIPLEEVPSKLKSLVSSVKKLEAELAALKISSLKRLNKGSNIIILDSYADSSKIVAKTLTRLGFGNCWIVADGFSGGRGWLQSRLGTDTYNFSYAEVISPSKVIPAGRRFGTTGSVPSGQKLLPE